MLVATLAIRNICDKTQNKQVSSPTVLQEPYLKWVWARAQNLMMPFIAVLPVVMELVAEGDEPYTIIHPDMPTNFEDLKRSWIQLKEERDTFKAQCYANEKKVLKLTKLLHEERNINAYLGTKRKRPWETWSFRIYVFLLLFWTIFCT